MASPILPSLSRSAALVAAAALAGAGPRAMLAQAGAGARVPLRTPCTGAAPTRQALRVPLSPDEETTRRLLELRAARVAAGAAAAAAGAGGSGAGGVATPRPARAEIVQFHSRLNGRGYLGVRMLEVSDVRETPAGRTVRYCAYPVVLSVSPESPADRAGLLQGDTLVAYNDRDLVQSGEIELDRILVPGETVRVSLRRDGRSLVKPVVVGRQEVNVVQMWTGDRGEMVIVSPSVAGGEARTEIRPSTGRVAVGSRMRVATPAPSGEATVTVSVPGTPVAPVPPAFIYLGGVGGGPTPLAGAQFLPLDDDWREALGARTGAGVVVVRVIPGTPAAELGLRSGDVIRTAGGHAVTSPQEFQRVLAAARAAAAADDRPVQVEVERRGQRKTIVLKW